MLEQIMNKLEPSCFTHLQNKQRSLSDTVCFLDPQMMILWRKKSIFRGGKRLLLLPNLFFFSAFSLYVIAAINVVVVVAVDVTLSVVVVDVIVIIVVVASVIIKVIIFL